MHRYYLEGVYTKKSSNELLKELRKNNKNVISVCVIYSTGELYIDFEKEPEDSEINELKNMFKARYIKKVRKEESIEEIT